VTDIKRFESATAAFQERYFQLPGDMTNATDFWGAAHTTAATCRTTISTGEETCDGDGDGKIWTSGQNAESNESFRAWQHLANAGLIEGSFNGVGTVSSDPQAGGSASVNTPASRISNATYSIRDLGTLSSSSIWFDRSYNNLILFGVNSENAHGEIITSEEAWNIDKKLDDGKPAYGKVMTYKNGAGASYAENCATTSTSSTAEYNLSTSGNICSLIFLLGF
jgi:hypothetical protein